MNTTLIKRAIIHEIDEIMNFIDKEWKKNHILSKNKELFEYDFREEELLNFIIAKSPNNQILGLIGYIKSNTSNHSDIWASIWKVSSLNKYPLLGLYLLNYLRKKIHYRHFIVSGINKNTIDIYKRLGMQTGILKQAYILNPCKKGFEIAKINILKQTHPKPTKCGVRCFAKIPSKVIFCTPIPPGDPKFIIMTIFFVTFLYRSLSSVNC